MAKAMIRFRPLGQTTLDYYSVGEKIYSESKPDSENKNRSSCPDGYYNENCVKRTAAYNKNFELFES